MKAILRSKLTGDIRKGGSKCGKEGICFGGWGGRGGSGEFGLANLRRTGGKSSTGET